VIKASDYIAQSLYKLGARHVFMVTGGGAMHLNDSFVRAAPFKVTFNHHEQASAIAAEGLYRASGSIGVVNVTTGPGGLNALTGVMGQWTDSIPAIYVSGQVKYETTVASCREIGLRQLGDQEVDIITIVRPLCKYAVSITDPNAIRREIEKAFHIATTGRMGPVWIDVPMNVQGARVDEAGLDGFVPQAAPSPVFDATEIAQLLLKAERPAIVAGHGIRLSSSVAAARELVDALHVPVLATFNGFDLVENDHPCYCGRIGTVGTRGGNFTLQNADLVLELGTRNNIRQTSYGWGNFAHRARTIVVDVDAPELTKPTFHPSVGVHADLAAFLPALLGAVRSEISSRPASCKDHTQWLAWARERSRKYPTVGPTNYAVKPRIDPYAFFERFTTVLPADAILVAGNGTACVVLFQAGVAKHGQRVFWNSGCAAMGFDLPAALGAAVGTGRTVWCLAGDGSLQMNIQELATVAANSLPIKLVYLNNGGYASIRQTQQSYFGSHYGCGAGNGLAFPDMEKLALAYGIPYARSAQIGDIGRDQTQVQSIHGPVIWEILLTVDYSFEPKLSSEKLPDGRMVSKPLEDMFPFLSRDEFNSNMILKEESP
jgi:acetolactate synthase I/II/III large subunit